MRKFVFYLALILAFTSASCARAFADVPINSTNFPDENFRDFILENFDKNWDEVLSQAEINAVTEMNISNRYIESIYGIWHFTALKRLDCSGNYIQEFSFSGLNALEYLNISYNNLNSYGNVNVIDISKFPSLKYLDCSHNSMSYLDASGHTKLEELICSDNHFTAQLPESTLSTSKTVPL